MSNKQGWIKLYRQIQDSALWDDGEPFDKAHAWIDLLLCVNHADRQKMIAGEIVTVKQGEMFTSDKFLANRWHWSRNRVRRFLETIERNNMIYVKRTPNGTWLNVVNYAKYQGQRTTNGTGYDTTDGTTNGTADGTTDGTQYKNIKNIKNDNNANNFFCAGALKKIPPEKSDVEAYCRQKRYRGMDIDGFFEYYDMRDWKLAGGLKMPDWTKAVDYWHSKGKKEAEKGQTDAPYLEEFDNAPMVVGSEVPFKNGLAAEMLRRKREKNAR